TVELIADITAGLHCSDINSEWRLAADQAILALIASRIAFLYAINRAAFKFNGHAFPFVNILPPLMRFRASFHLDHRRFSLKVPSEMIQHKRGSLFVVKMIRNLEAPHPESD